MINIFKNKEKKEINNNDFLFKVAALLIHTAKIDEVYTDDENEIIKETLIKLGAENSNIDKIMLKATLDEENSNQILDFTREIKNTSELSKIKIIEALWEIIYSNKKADNLFEISLESFNRYLNINVLSLFSVCREFARNNSKGTIVNFSSTYGITSPMPDLYPGKNEKHIGYGVPKAAVIQLTRHLAIHLAPNFTVNCVAPGGVKHEQDKNFIEKYYRIME